MTTKTSLKYASNAHSGGIMESHSPAALLDMLAEVASQTLHSEKNHTNAMFVSSQYTSKSDAAKKKPHELFFTASQLLSMPASQLVKQFSIFTSDELKRQYSYTCALVAGCGQKYTSFASEGKARISIKAHLAEHLQYLKTNKEAYNTFSAKSIISKNNKLNIQTKKNKMLNFKKPQEAVNKENKNIVAEKPASYLRNILLQDGSFKEVQKDINFERRNNLKKLLNSQKEDAYKAEHKVLGDHSYFERLKDELPGMEPDVSSSNLLESTAASDSIVFMVVGSDSVHTREYSACNQDESKTTCVNNVFLSEVPWSEETTSRSNDVISTKPKGKAKFIGTSKEEREMALAFMDRIKKKGNPTGNNLECRICKPPRTFTAPTTLVSHYRSHAGIKPYECRICSAVFTRRHSLKYHMLIHQNQTRFTCADCGKKFRHPSHFREHRRRHTGEAPFGCDDCGQRFKTRNTYKRHLKTRHGKVLTTTGELLHLSEEDFEKVKTNRKKKVESNKEHILNQEIIEPQKDSGYNVNVDELLTTVKTNEKCSANTCFATDNDSTIDALKENFQTYEICIESQSMKTETIETDMHGDKTVFNTNVNNIEQSCFVKVEDALQEMENSCYEDSLELVQVQKTAILSRERTEENSTLVFRAVDEVTPYVQYNTGINNRDTDSIEECQRNSDISMREVEHHIEIVGDKEKDYTVVTVGHEEDTDIQYIESIQESQEVPVTMISSAKQQSEDGGSIIMKVNMNNSKNNTAVGNVNSNRLLTKHDGAVMNIAGIAEHIDVLHLLSRRISCTQPKITNTFRDEHNSDVTKGKEVICLSTSPQQANNHDNEHNRLKVMHAKSKQIALPLWSAQEINIKNVQKIGKQSAILLLSNDVLKNSILSIGENVTAISTDKLSID